jgi:hypothetical protein
MTDCPRPEDFMAMGLFIYEFSQLERFIDSALAEALALIPAPKQGHRTPDRFQKRVQMLLTIHRTKPLLKAYRSEVEPLLQELKKLLLMRNDIAHGRLDEYRHDVLGAQKEWRRCVVN